MNLSYSLPYLSSPIPCPSLFGSLKVEVSVYVSIILYTRISELEFPGMSVHIIVLWIHQCVAIVKVQHRGRKLVCNYL